MASASALAGGMISVGALFNAGARLLGGVVSRLISAKTLLIAGAGDSDRGPGGAQRRAR